MCIDNIETVKVPWPMFNYVISVLKRTQVRGHVRLKLCCAVTWYNAAMLEYLTAVKLFQICSFSV